MNPKFSIIIPHAFAKCDELLKPCLESIIKFTDLPQVEIIVVLNGATDHAEEYIKSLGEPFRSISFPEAVGYPKAVNAGIKESKGEFIILLNNDCILLDQEKNKWIDILYAPFNDPNVMISGPWLNYDPNSERDFLIFFCAMLRRTIFDKIGLLDEEAFTFGIGEDTDFCHKTVDAGYKISAVDITDYKWEQGMGLGFYPIYHKGNATYSSDEYRSKYPGEELIFKNREILKQRYSGKSINIQRALACDGFMSPEELTWLAKTVKTLR